MDAGSQKVDLNALLALADKHEGSLPPIHLWEPETLMPQLFAIDRQGKWTHEGEPINRQALVKLFASILKKEGHDYYLITPHEKYPVLVEDVPFVIEHLVEKGRQSCFVTQMQDIIAIDGTLNTDLRPYDGNELPYIWVRDELWARVSRAVYYQLTSLESLTETGEGYSVSINNIAIPLSLKQ